MNNMKLIRRILFGIFLLVYLAISPVIADLITRRDSEKGDLWLYHDRLDVKVQPTRRLQDNPEETNIPWMEDLGVIPGPNGRNKYVWASGYWMWPVDPIGQIKSQIPCGLIVSEGTVADPVESILARTTVYGDPGPLTYGYLMPGAIVVAGDAGVYLSFGLGAHPTLNGTGIGVMVLMFSFDGTTWFHFGPVGQQVVHAFYDREDPADYNQGFSVNGRVTATTDGKQILAYLDGVGGKTRDYAELLKNHGVYAYQANLDDVVKAVREKYALMADPTGDRGAQYTPDPYLFKMWYEPLPGKGGFTQPGLNAYYEYKVDANGKDHWRLVTLKAHGTPVLPPGDYHQVFYFRGKFAAIVNEGKNLFYLESENGADWGPAQFFLRIPNGGMPFCAQTTSDHSFSFYEFYWDAPDASDTDPNTNFWHYWHFGEVRAQTPS